MTCVEASNPFVDTMPVRIWRSDEKVQVRLPCLRSALWYPWCLYKASYVILFLLQQRHFSCWSLEKHGEEAHVLLLFSRVLTRTTARCPTINIFSLIIRTLSAVIGVLDLVILKVCAFPKSRPFETWSHRWHPSESMTSFLFPLRYKQSLSYVVTCGGILESCSTTLYVSHFLKVRIAEAMRKSCGSLILQSRSMPTHVPMRQ